MWSTAYCILVVVLTTVQGSNDTWSLPAAPNCKTSELPGSVVEWRESNSLSYSVEWSYGNGTCSSLNSCFDLGLDDADDQRLDAQITPLHIQPGDQVRFFASQNMDIPFAIFPHRVDEEGFINCDISRGKPIVPQPSKEPIAVLEEFLRPGVNYFITNRSDTLYQCRFGLRVNITVKIQKCNGPGGDPGKCWNQGRCLTSPLQTDFQCSCCNGFTGDYCFEEDGCATEPCLNGGSCVDLKGSQAPKKFACSCPQGWIGDRCETRVANQCVDAPCENNATCIGNADDYRCECPHGFTGHHCTVNIDDCATDPCDNGICVDQIGGYQCYCTPGYGGHNCDMKYSPCRSNPCKNNGYCIDRKGDYECHCDAGYTGPHCTQKVNLCGPSACFNATECIDNGNTFECVCAHGFKGHHCEIDINECEMKPCENGGKCLDAVGGYTCLCLREFQGKHCELYREALHHRCNIGWRPDTRPGRSRHLLLQSSRDLQGFHSWKMEKRRLRQTN
ncbi:hypothetical protein CAPTEDRAFT_223657 [Capitella teleta]|uniref:EGF-like domain-containing protein n=1 Tax=Capitella teleta TaxID=283909 RepID=R7UTG1_CAPTE|nr:hypothetical protein CAPTEDRAFT_223657 [Capitella teleta]|eukprot:ELU09448.1 hypothetical protein CAPTEDRAFT_223657 [Capitella teleta]